MQNTTGAVQIDGWSQGSRPVFGSLLRGAMLKCPACGIGSMFRRYLKVADHCSQCGEALHHHRADDAPPYFTMLIVGHVIVGGLLALERAFAPPGWVQAAVWLPLTLIMTLLLLSRVKGALIGLQWALHMHGFGHDFGHGFGHGFGSTEDDEDPLMKPEPSRSS
jgi:uncharacterized protein (DUF983 family)